MATSFLNMNLVALIELLPLPIVVLHNAILSPNLLQAPLVQITKIYSYSWDCLNHLLHSYLLPTIQECTMCTQLFIMLEI
jgi:hypothetical protein